MTFSALDIKKWVEEWEGVTLDFKLKDIISDTYKIAKTMVAFGNNKFVSEDYGGRIVIGVNDKTRMIEGVEFDPKHEEHFMNIARDKIVPSMNPNFEKAEVDGKTVYVITLQKMLSVPYQQITKEGNVHWIRVGSTIREPTYHELSLLYNNSSATPKIDDRFDLQKSLPDRRSASRRIIIVPLDANSRIISFDKLTTDFIKTRVPLYQDVRQITLKQKELHIVGEKLASEYKSYGILNDLGVFCYEELIDLFSSGMNKIIIGREIIFLVGLIRYISMIYKKIGYGGRIQILYSHFSVQNYSFTGDTSDKTGGIWWDEHPSQLSDIEIDRTISQSTLDEKKLVSSILEEIAKACNWSVDVGFFENHINKTISQYF